MEELLWPLKPHLKDAKGKTYSVTVGAATEEFEAN